MAFIAVATLLLAVFAVLLPPSHGASGDGFHPARCVASLVRRLPCADAEPLATIRLHLEAYRMLGSASLVATVVLLATVWLRLAPVETSPRSRGPGGGGAFFPLSPFLAISPWRIQRILRRWLVLRKDGNAASR